MSSHLGRVLFWSCLLLSFGRSPADKPCPSQSDGLKCDYIDGRTHDNSEEDRGELCVCVCVCPCSNTCTCMSQCNSVCSYTCPSTNLGAWTHPADASYCLCAGDVGTVEVGHSTSITVSSWWAALTNCLLHYYHIDYWHCTFCYSGHPLMTRRSYTFC